MQLGQANHRAKVAWSPINRPPKRVQRQLKLFTEKEKLGEVRPCLRHDIFNSLPFVHTVGFIATVESREDDSLAGDTEVAESNQETQLETERQTPVVIVPHGSRCLVTVGIIAVAKKKCLMSTIPGEIGESNLGRSHSMKTTTNKQNRCCTLN